MKIIITFIALCLSLQTYTGESFPEIRQALKLYTEGKMKKEKVISLIDKSSLPVKVSDLEIVTIKGVKTVRWHMVSPTNEIAKR